MTDKELQKEAEEYVSPEVWGDTYYINCCGDWHNEDMQKAYIDARKKSEEQINYQQSVIRTQHKTINKLQRYREAIDAIASICDLVLCGATNWDEEQLDEHFEHVYKLVKWSQKEN